MQLLSLYIRNNRNLLDKKTVTIDWTLHSPMQLLIGNNGFGKSSLLDNFSPLPAVAKEYTKTGMKKVLVEHNNKRYRLTSDFSKKHKHSFIDLETDKELNLGGTITVQYDLCKRILGYDTEIHGFLKGKVKLTKLSAKDRKDFFGRVSDVPIDYAVKVYDELRVEARNLAGVQKYNKQKVFDETKKLLSSDKKKQYVDEITELKELTITLMEGKFNNHQPADIDIQQLYRDIETMSETVVETHLTYTGYSSLDVLDEEIQHVDKNKAVKKDALKHILKNIEESKTKLDAISTVTKYPTSRVKLDIADLEQQLANYSNRLKEHNSVLTTQFSDSKQLSTVSATLENAKLVLQNALAILPENPKKNLADDALLTHIGQIKEQTIKHIDQINLEITHRNETLRAIKEHDSVNCPKCDHVFIPGVDVKSIPRLEQENVKATELLERFTNKLAKCNERLDEIQAYREQHSHIRNQLTSYHLTQLEIDGQPLSTRLMQDELFYTSPSSLAFLLEDIVNVAKLNAEKLNAQHQLDELNELLVQREKLGITDEDAEYTTNAITSLEDEYSQSLDEYRHFETTHRTLTALKQRLINESRYQFGLLQKVKLLNQYFKDLVKTKINKSLDTQTHDLSVRIAQLTETLTSCSITEGIIDHLNETLEQVEIDIILYRNLIDALGPQKGLIGKSLISFTNYFIERMNEVIKAIWLTPLTIAPMTVTEKGFSYQFRVITYSEENASSDVSETSSGESEIIDFAFMLITASCLELTDYPLLLDEVGKFFKAEHKVRLYDYLKLLSEHDKASNIVVISHFIGMYEALTRADVCRIDPTGIEVQEHENKSFLINEDA